MPRTRLIGAALAALLLLPSTSLPAFARKHSKKLPPAPAIQRMNERQRAIHALNRLTFGPRPGDVDRVLAMGVDKWIAQQLEPGKIDDSALEARLAPYRTLRMTTVEMVENFPPEQVLRAVADGKMAMPKDPQLKAVYTAGVARFNDKQAKKNAKAVESADLLEMNPADDLSQEMKEKRREARDHARSRALDLMEMAPESRTQNLAGMDADERRGFWRALSQDDRDKLTSDMTPQQKELLLSLENPVAVVNGELLQGKLLRATYSERQLQEVMTDFWFNHFNVFIGKGAERYLVTAYERDVIRPRALGKFSELLLATAKSPAMLWYLDNWQSVGPNSQAAARAKNNGKPSPGLNENYAREVMELHTLGVNGGYTQKDVTELARVLTGWTLEEPRQGGGFVFREPRHEPGDKTVLGRVFHEGGHEDGQREGEAALEMLAHEPATARFISTKLAQRFVSDTPPPALVDAMARTFLESDGDIKAVLRTMLARAGVLGRKGVSREGEDAAGVYGVGAAGDGRRADAYAERERRAEPHGNAALRGTAADGIFDARGELGELRGAAEPDELCAAAGHGQAGGSEDGCREAGGQRHSCRNPCRRRAAHAGAGAARRSGLGADA